MGLECLPYPPHHPGVIDETLEYRKQAGTFDYEPRSMDMGRDILEVGFLASMLSLLAYHLPLVL